MTSFRRPLKMLDEDDSENVTEAKAREEADNDAKSRRRRAAEHEKEEKKDEEVEGFDYEKERYDCMILYRDLEGFELKMRFDNCRLMGYGGVCRRKLFNQTATCPIGWFYQDGMNNNAFPIHELKF